MAVENKSYLGWGLLGTPKGRQQIAECVSKQLDSAKLYDLEQEFGACLPNPSKDEEKLPLYCISFKSIKGNSIIGISEYRSIFEQGQTRPGTFFGSFIESVNSIFDENGHSLMNTLSGLYDLSKYQYDHFIDRQTNSYTTNLIDKTFSSPNEKLDKIATELKGLQANFFNQTAQSGVLYVQYNSGQEIEVLQRILSNQLYYRFQKIFFSESKYISAQMKNKNVEFYSLEQLEGSELFMKPALKQIQSYQVALTQRDEKLQQLQNELKTAQEHQAQIIEQNVKQQVEGYIQQAEQYRQAAEQAQNEKMAFQHYAEYGQQILQTTAENAEKLERYDLVQFISNSPNERDQKLNTIENRLATLSLQLSNLNNKTEQREIEVEVPQSRGWSFYLAWLFGIVSLSFLLSIIAWAVLSPAKVDKTALDEANKKLEEVQKELSNLKQQTDSTKIEQMKKENERLKKESDEINKCLADTSKHKKLRDIECLKVNP